MAHIVGQIEPLKKLRETLNKEGITRFSSIGEINRFLRDYNIEHMRLKENVALEFDQETEQIKKSLTEQKQGYEELKLRVKAEQTRSLQKLSSEIEKIETASKKSFAHNLFFSIPLFCKRKKKQHLERNSEQLILKQGSDAYKELVNIEKQLEYHVSNRSHLIAERSERRLVELTRTKQVVDSLYSLIAGALGESKVIDTLKQLPDDFHVLNDYSIEFYPPIYRKDPGERISSIQIDHLLICPAGVFILETKNWSEASVKNLDLRSPVEQIKRTSYALFSMLNSDSDRNDIKLESHHWGDKKIPLRNVIVMTNAKPHAEFKHVKVVALRDLIGYINYFERIFNAGEVFRIANYLKRRK